MAMKLASLLLVCCMPLVLAAMKVEPPASLTKGPLQVPAKILMGPGPSTPHPRILAAQGLPVLGHMHPEFLQVMTEVKDGLRYALQTENEMTLAVSGTGHGGMEATVANIVEPGDEVIVGVNGIWGQRMLDLVERYGAKAHRMEVPPGEVFSLAQITAAVDQHPKSKIVFLVHGESSTGTYQSLDGVGDLCHKHGMLLYVDTVCTLGGVSLNMDAEKVDVVYSGSQKVLGVPPGTSPVSFSPRARAKMDARKEKVQSYYFDMNLVGEYWGVDGQKPAYHHTGMISNVYALREGLALLAEEGLEACWERHAAMARDLHAGLARLGLELFVKDPKARLPTVTTIKVPEGVDWLAVNKFIMKKYNVEIAGGLGPTVGKVWRIGIMGFNAKPMNIQLTLVALEDALKSVGHIKSEL